MGEMTETLWSVLGGYGTIFRAFRLSRQVDYLNLVLREYAKCTADSLCTLNDRLYICVTIIDTFIVDRITGKIKNYSLKLDVVKLSLSQSGKYNLYAYSCIWT